MKSNEHSLARALARSLLLPFTAAHPPRAAHPPHQNTMAAAPPTAPPSFAPVEAKMKAAGLSDAAVAAFRLNFDALASGATGLVSASFLVVPVRATKKRTRICRPRRKKGTSPPLPIP